MYHSVACIWIVFSYIWFPYYFYIKGAVTRYCNNDGLWDDPDYTVEVTYLQKGRTHCHSTK
jgi:hypothetical protein